MKFIYKNHINVDAGEIKVRKTINSFRASLSRPSFPEKDNFVQSPVARLILEVEKSARSQMNVLLLLYIVKKKIKKKPSYVSVPCR